MNKSQLNINNLMELWKAAGCAYHNYAEHKTFFYAHVKGTDWPRRIWTDKPLSKDIVMYINERMKEENGLTFSNFNTTDKENELLTLNDFELKFIQYGMSLRLNEKFKTKREIRFEEIKTTSDAEKWNETFYQAFNYSISAKTVLKTKDDIEYYLVYHNNDLIGTIVFFITNNVIGIHSLGIIPSMRKKGYATEIMHYALNFVKYKTPDLITLQASEMAKGLYEKLGFSHDFIMENYQLKQ